MLARLPRQVRQTVKMLWTRVDTFGTLSAAFSPKSPQPPVPSAMLRIRPSTIVALLLAIVVVCAHGCQSWHEGTGIWSWRGQGYDDEVNALTENLRPPGDQRRFTGIDAKARDIERNLGVR